MHVWRLSIVFCTFSIIHLFMCASSTRVKQYKRKFTYDNKSCKHSDINMRANLSNAFGCLTYSMGRRCGTVFYNLGTGACIGCSSMYLDANDLIYEDGSTAYEFANVCQGGDETFETSCYRQIPTTNWTNAKDTCFSIAHNSHLAVPDSDEENSYMTSWITRRDYSNQYIGVVVITTNGPYLTVQGHEAVFTNWKEGEPNNYLDIGENCTEMYYSGEWNDAPCNLTQDALCEYELLINV